MQVNNTKENENQKYNFITELKLVKSSSYRKINRKLGLDELNGIEKRKTKSKSRFKSRSKNRNKKKKKNKKIKFLYLNKSNRKHDYEFDKKNINYEFKIIFGKIIVKKKYLKEIVKRRQLYSEKVKKIKILKRNESVKPKEDTQLDLIKKYSFKVLCTNRAVINSKKFKDKDILDKQENTNKSNIKSEILETPPKKQKLNLPPILKKTEIINNIHTPIISVEPKIISKPLILIQDNTDTNTDIISNSFNLKQNNDLNYNENNDKPNNLNKSNPEILSLNKNNDKKRNINNLKIFINDSSRNNIVKQAQSFDNSPQKLIITDSAPTKKLKKERSDFGMDFHKLYYAIGPGNASYLVKNCMLHRTNWKESYSYVSNLFNFKWLQISHGIDYFNLSKIGGIKQIVNHFENHKCISNKANLFKNMVNYCEQRKISAFKYIPFTLIFELKVLDNPKEEKNKRKLEKLQKLVEDEELKFVKKYEDIGKYFNEEEFIEEKKRRREFFIENSPKKNKILYYEREEAKNEDSEDEKKIFEGKYILYKDFFGGLKFKEKPENKLKDNKTFNNKDKEKPKIMPKHIGDNTAIELPDTHASGKGMWIIKAINLNRGMCIKIVNSYKKMIYILNQFKKGVHYDFTSKNEEDTDNNDKKENKKDFSNNLKVYFCEKVLIQKYIEKPLLYKGRKCDMRVWVLVTHNMKVYFFKEGHLKTCSISYDIDSKNAFSHITNYSFQKYNEYFQKYEKGNEVPFYEFQKFIDEEYPEKNYKIKTNLYSQIKEIISISMRSVKEKLSKNCGCYQFEIFGYDFMLDENFNLFLIEVNTNPGLEESSPWIQIIIPRMLDDTLRLTIDQLFNPGYDFSKMYKSDKKNNLNLILSDFKDKINYEKHLLKTEIINQNKNDEKLEEQEKFKRMNTEIINIKDLIEKIDKTQELKNETIKNEKYISPFPVPGYKDDDNLWEFVCDLTSKDPLDDFLDKEEDKCYTGFRYLFNKKKNNES